MLNYDESPSAITSSYENEIIVNRALQIAMACEEPDDEIYQFIAEIGKRINCERMYIFEPNTDGSYRNTYEWCADGVIPQKNFLQTVPVEDMTLWMEMFSKGEYVIIEDVDAIADTEPTIYRWLKPQNIHSLMACPLLGGKSFMGADNPIPGYILHANSLLEIVGHFTETMIRRRDLTRQLRWADLTNNQYRKFSREMHYQLSIADGRIEYDRDMAKKLDYPMDIDTFAKLTAYLSNHPEFNDKLMKDGINKAIETGENRSVDFLSYKNDRTITWNRLSINPFLNSDGTVTRLYGIVQDISEERKFVEQYNKYIKHVSGGLHICYLSQPIHLEYASDELITYLGYTREEFEQLVNGIYTNVMVEEDRPKFAGYAMHMAKGPGTESCEYRLRKKDGTVIEVIDTMEAFYGCNGLLYGYAYVLDKSELHIKLEMVEESEKKHLEMIDRQHEILEALVKDYQNVFRVWLDEDKGQIFKLNGYGSKELINNSEAFIPYYRLCRQYVLDHVHPDDREKMLHAMHPDTVRKAFAESDDYVVVYRVLKDGEVHYHQMTYVRLNNPDNLNQVNFVAGFKNVDKVIHEEHEKNVELQNRLDIISAILGAFDFGYYFDYQNDTFTELSKPAEMMVRTIGKKGRLSECLTVMKGAFTDSDTAERIDAFLDPETLDERMQGRRLLSSQIYILGYGWYELFIFVVDYDENGKIAHTVYATRDITQEKNREERYIHSLDAANNREQAALQVAYTDTLTGVMNRNALERDYGKIHTYSSIGIVYCDVNNLKETNDTLGHSEGDRLLQDFSGILKKFFPVECIYRTGGDEFICLMKDIDQDCLTDKVSLMSYEINAHKNFAAFGISYGDTKDADALIREAEVSMYRMKHLQKTVMKCKES